MPIDINNLLQQFKQLSPDKQKLFRDKISDDVPTKKVYTLDNIIQERKYKKIKLLKMCIKVINNIRWSMLNDRPLIPV